MADATCGMNILYSKFCLNKTYAVYESFPNFHKDSIAVFVIIHYKHIAFEISTNNMNNFYNFFLENDKRFLLNARCH